MGPGPSACWWYSDRRTVPTKRPEPFRVWTIRAFPLGVRRNLTFARSLVVKAVGQEEISR